MKSLSNKSTKLALCSMLTLASSMAFSAPALEEVLVTAQKREQSAQDVPISVTAMSAEVMTKNGLNNLQNMSEMIPNLNIGATTDDTVITMRGLGSGGGNPSFEQAVGLYIDGIYAGRAAQFQVPFLDIAAVEVVRGPQGVLFGKNSIAGAVSIITQKPSDAFEGYISGAYNSFSQYETTAVLNIPLTERLSTRIVAKRETTGGFLSNEVQHTDDPDSENESLRIAFTWDVSDNFNIFFKAENSRQTAINNSFQLTHYDRTAPNAYTGDPASQLIIDLVAAEVFAQQNAAGEDYIANEYVFSNAPSGRTIISDNFTLKLTTALGEHELTWLGGYSEYEKENEMDGDISASNFIYVFNDEYFDQTSQELRVASPTGGTIEYIGGLFYMDRRFYQPNYQIDLDLLFAPRARFTSNSDYEEPTKSMSAFFQGTWNIFEQLSLTAGARRSHEVKKGRASQDVYRYGSPDDQSEDLPGDQAFRETLASALGRNPYVYDYQTRKENNTDYTVNAQWTPSDDLMFYYTHARASKGGGFNASEATGDISKFEFESELAKNHEIGAKLQLFDNRLRINSAIFYTNFDNLQVSNFNGTEFITGNAAEATTKGVELEIMFAATESLLFGGNVARLSAKYDSFPGAPCPGNQNDWGEDCRASDGQGREAAGEQLALASEWSATMFIDYSHLITDHLTLNPRLDIIYSGETPLDASHQKSTIQDEYIKYNASIQLSAIDNQWSLILGGYNLTDETTLNFAAPTVVTTGVTLGNVNDPRTYALSFRWNFGAY
ncbi:TonB-dependent receptor [Spongiibacter sp. KMU-166]|uniref:TonB-dependent receptor n=1 Tax=Spongiibacter thalassae TaxID=2721624 RepID=A0ABX1GAC6_9GAMM|nr:TonB-dependent receptor [Spongiibacter thalassae]NKI15886.1 TonB-dependent receptor [Spongiibacter thalassae]